MVWGMELPGDYGPCFPSGKFLGYDEQLEANFNAMTDEEKAFFENNVKAYRLHVSQCFKYEHGTMHGEKRLFRPVAENEWPQEFRMSRRYKRLGSLVMGTDGLLMVEKAFKEILEDLEPGVHQFRPIRMS